MVQPYNYSIDIESPGQAFLKGMQIGQAGRAAQAKAAEQEREADKLRRLNAALAKLGPNATYADYMAEVRANPDLADLLLGQQKTFSDARKNAMFGAGEQAFMLLRPDAQGNISPDAAIAKLEESALAFENSGESDIAKQLRDSAQGIRVNPAAARGVLGTMLAFADADRFKKISEAAGIGGELTSFQKDLIAAGIDPNGTEGRSLSEQYARGRADPIVEIETPDGSGIFRGPFSEYQRRYGYAAGAAGPAKQPQSQTRVFSNVTALPADLKSGDIVNGKRYLGGPTNQASSWAAPEGGQMGAPAPSGSFQGK